MWSDLKDLLVSISRTFVSGSAVSITVWDDYFRVEHTCFPFTTTGTSIGDFDSIRSRAAVRPARCDEPFAYVCYPY